MIILIIIKIENICNLTIIFAMTVVERSVDSVTFNPLKQIKVLRIMGIVDQDILI